MRHSRDAPASGFKAAMVQFVEILAIPQRHSPYDSCSPHISTMKEDVCPNGSRLCTEDEDRWSFMEVHKGVDEMTSLWPTHSPCDKNTMLLEREKSIRTPVANRTTRKRSRAAEGRVRWGVRSEAT